MSSRAIHRLTAGFVTSKKPAEGWHHDGGGLYLQNRNGGRSWILRFMLNGKVRNMGLGRLAAVSLAEARQAAADARKKIARGDDPVIERKKARDDSRTAEASLVTFEQATKDYLKFKAHEWTNRKHAAQWSATLETYAYPLLAKLPVQSIDTAMVKKVLEPIWTTKTETASRVRQRIEAVLDSAFAPMNPKPTNPARWKGHLDKILPKPQKVKKTKHFEAMHYNELPGFFADLTKRNNQSAAALAFAILNASRTNEVLNARFEEIDAAGKVWTVPADRMKSKRLHRVPLSWAALALVKKGAEGLIFPNGNGEAMSDAAMRKYLQDDMGRAGLTVHGFRSSFRQWVKDCTNFSGEIAEAALAHVIGDKTEAAYNRSDALERRRQLMDSWARYCTGGKAATGEVIPIGKRA